MGRSNRRVTLRDLLHNWRASRYPQHIDLCRDVGSDQWRQWAKSINNPIAELEFGRDWCNYPAWDLWRSRAESGDGDAARVLARPLIMNGEFDDAENWLRRATEEYSPAPGAAMRDLAHLLQRSGRTKEANQWLHSAASASDLYATCELEDRAGGRLQAEQMLRHAVEAGDPFAWGWLLERLIDTGRPDEAERLRKYGIEPGGRTIEPW